MDGRWTFFVSDGYTNTRVVKFDRNGKFLTQWGMDGKGRDDEARPYYFDTGRPQKFRPKAGVDRALLIGRATRGR